MSAQVHVPVFLQCHDHTLMFFDLLDIAKY